LSRQLFGAGAQRSRLIYPGVALDALRSNVELLGNSPHVVGAPSGDMREGRHAHGAQLRLEARTDAPDQLQIAWVRSFATRGGRAFGRQSHDGLAKLGFEFGDPKRLAAHAAEESGCVGRGSQAAGFELAIGGVEGAFKLDEIGVASSHAARDTFELGTHGEELGTCVSGRLGVGPQWRWLEG
jgi:hypothetical protein